MDEGEKVQHVNTREVPLYGLGQHHIQLDSETSCSEDAEFYVLVQGSRLTHVTAAKMGDDGQTLSFVVPGHDLPEAVSFTPYRLSEEHVEPCGTEFSFQYVKDVAQDIAEYLISSSNQLGPQSYLHIQNIFCQSTQSDEEFADIREDLRLLDEKITCAMSNLVYPPEWTKSDWQTWQHNETDSDLQNSKPLLHLAVHLGLVHLSHFITYQLKSQRPLTLSSQDVDAPLIAQKREEHSADSVAGVWCMWSDSSSMLRFCPATNSLCLTVQHSLGQSSHQTILLTLRERLKDPRTLKLVTAFKSCSENDQKQHSNDKDLKKKCVEETQTNNDFEEHLVLSVDDESCEVCPSSLSVNNPLQFDGKYNAMNIQNDDTCEGDTAVDKLHISGVTRDSTRTDSQSWDIGDSTQTLMDCSNMDNVDLSPSLVALELNSEDDSTDAMNDNDEKDAKLKDFSPFSALTCNRSLSASSCEHTSKEPKQDIRLRSYSYSSSKIGFHRDQSTRDFSPDHLDSVSYGRSLLQALSLSKSLSLLHPYKQKPCISEQSHQKRIEEEEQDKYNTPVKVESEKHKVIRTFSFLKNRMSTTRNKSKGKKDREAKDRQLNGHQFSTGPCLGSTMCVVCDKPATGKAILHCSVCTAIVHKSCKDSIPPCLKTFQNKYAVPMAKNKTASLPQNFTVRESLPNFIPVPTCLLFDDKKDIAKLPGKLLRSAERLENEHSESESDNSQITSSTEDPIITPVPNTDFSSGEDCVDAYIYKDILVDAAHYEAESWSSSVDHKFYRKQDKKCVKRQDVIYELMQTEIHHLQTLHVMAEVFRRGVKEEVQLDADAVERLFPCLDQLLLFHHGFFSAMKERRQNSQSQGQNNYLIQRIGDVLLQQFSDENGKRMTHLYGEFCSHHMEAVRFFKELQLNNKKFQNFIKQQGNNYLVRRREIPECILLVTQRITKYPVLLERILQYTQTGTEEHSNLTKALALIRGLIAAVDQRVCKYERQQKLQEVWTRMENRSSAKLKNGHTFRKQDMMRPGQTLLHEGVLLWKSATGRLKDVLALLLTDTLIFLQEKDQKFVFAAVDQKPPVIALQKLIVREVANEERGMFLISASTAGPEMYEVHTSSKDERNTWMRLIREAVESCPEEEQDYTSESEEERRAADARLQKIHRLQESLLSHDQQICTSLEEKLQIYAELSAVGGKNNSSLVELRLLVQQHQEDAPQAALLLSAALQEAEKLKTILSAKTYSPPGGNLESDVDSVFSVSPSSHLESSSNFTYVTNPEENEESWSKENSDFHSLIEMQKKEIDSKVSQSVLSLTQLLYSLKAAVTLQDSWYEVQRLLASETERPSPRLQPRPHFTSLRGNTLQEQEKQRNLEKRKEEVATTQKLQDQLRQEKERWERECQTRENQHEELQRRLQEREKQCHLEAERLKREREELDAQLEEYQQSLERLREGQKTVEKERERLETQNKRLQVWRHSQQRDTEMPHMVIALDTHQPADPNDNSSVFVNEANTIINNRHVRHRENDPSTHNCLNALLARSNSRRPPSALSTPHPESDSPTWMMSPQYFYSPTGGQGNGHTPTDHREGSIREAWSSTAGSCFMLPHHSDPLDLFSTEADSNGEEPKEETIVYL
ncbi:rho guanine nucleotide exchange factor 28 isoform X2 [Periophthalmus magnuspinnatus]|uniref:rho guanine nucleotide exchange factor 28 isoform X2 n=1 Tax=Periophthalmus magnuspinnatus TaxID=409849 RepID=UPI00243670D5|nr:rho guanine nucleotide exchange factor 28 isoform X2 [Periophthalmus magnuspinnatus]